ncbi:hypothetical protein Gasu2_40510 [Galdieria sulphuraria]|uniref:BZIP domain-containing protein n=1 Tax=Galdieria sulphuraria TaxID=130081 RepID=M2Y7E2_GALSU|nr:uncharacterized protein Gasu_07130 [Galdieria sulphuraria]EME31963.1 hypothetical protein Gasu_07130 [Galdieria sulphuraria]GJD09822.1 hypothetical protein Gasu2_40510 [Galdieria sulphuraria]|eukprot:XP_005708483.1 hypothetical protein Gasu_07130 [Galdieria sulphuraria]
MESPTRKEEKQQPPTASSSEQEQTEQEKLPSFRNLMAEIQGVLESSTTQETPSTQVTQRIQIRKRPRVEAPLYVNIESQVPYEISPVSPFPGLRTAEYPLQSVEQLRVGETTYEGRKFVEEGTVVPQEGSTLERSHSAAREARRHRRQILHGKVKSLQTAAVGGLQRLQPTVTTSTEQTSPIIPTEVGSLRTTLISSETSTSPETEGVGEYDTSSQAVVKPIETEDHEEKKSTESIKESEAGPSSTPSFKRGRGRKREHPEWTEEQRQAQRIMKNREAAERARQRRKEREESLLRELTSAIERNRLLEEEIQRLRNLLKEVLPTSSGKNSQERSK